MTRESLDRLAALDRLKIYWTAGGASATIMTTIGFAIPLVTITIGDLTDEDGEKILNKLVKRSLAFLTELGT